MENAVIKMPRKDLEVMKQETALDLALQQQKVQQILETRQMVDSKYEIITGYQAVINIITTEKNFQKVAIAK